MSAADARHGFPPLAREDARVLILGSFPSVISLERQEYYANPRNQFWRIMGELFEFEPTVPYRERCHKLLERGITLWDVCKCAERSGSLDAAIDAHSVVPNDLVGFLSNHPVIDRVFVNGRTAANLLDRQNHGHSLLSRREVLPSTSPAHTIPFTDKMNAWACIRRAGRA